MYKARRGNSETRRSSAMVIIYAIYFIPDMDGMQVSSLAQVADPFQLLQVEDLDLSSIDGDHTLLGE
jgi:hypothetical protein